MAENKNITYPQFISNKPCGIDKFEGKSQERLTNAIVNHIVSNDNDNNTQNLSRIIGLEGDWGVGKSNVIKQLRKHDKINNGYFIFEYDAWGHQEDLQRRSFLEIITTELIEGKILLGTTKISIKGGGTQEVSWQEKLKYLLARKTEISTEKRPKLSIGIVAFIIATIFTSIAVSIANTIKNDCLILSILLPFIPFLIAAMVLWVILRKKNKNWKEIFNEIFSIYSGKIENEVSFETISEEEPTVTEFKNWMQEISNHSEKKIIIIYDNMDRLPAEKVKELWSSIHTFFSEDGFKNIWAIIPFDEKHLSCAFGESDNKEQLTKYFISKTFPVVYSVTPPVTTDFKNIFNTLFEEAFGNTEAENQDNINRIFRLEKPNATVREIIEYINQLVAIKNIWKDEIDLLYIAIFRLKKDEILKNPIEQILSGSYLGKYIPNIVANDEVLQKNISALIYGVSIKDAEQISMSKYLDSCFNLESNTDINKFANSSNFFSILSDKVQSSDTAQLDNIIHCLSHLDLSNLSKKNLRTITALWNTLSQRKIKSPLPKQEFNNNYKLLIQNADDSYKQNIIKRLCKQIQSFKEFNSENYFKALNELDNFITTNNIAIDIKGYLSDLEKEPEVFVDYVLSAKDNYTLYKVSVNPDALYKYMSDRISDKHSVLEVLKYLINDQKFQFNPVKIKIEETIQNQQLIKGDNFKPLFDAYKILSNKKPLTVQLNPTQRQTIWNALVSKPDIPDFLEIVAIQIANGTNIGINLNDEQIKYIAENIDYYANYGDLLINNLSWNIPLLRQVLKYMTENKLGYILPLEKILPKFFDIKNNLNVTEQVLLERLNDGENYKVSITSSNIHQLIPNAQFFQFSKATKNVLTDYLNKTIIEALSTIQASQLYQFKQQQPNHYWIIVINNLIDTDFLKSLPDNLTELGKRYLDDIAASRLTIPNDKDIVHKIINKLDGRKTVAHIKDIRDKFCNSQYNINPQLFLYFENWFEKQGDLKQLADRVTHKMIEPVINDTDCLNRIMAKSNFYAEIINTAGDDATTLKDLIRNKIKNSTNTNLISFAKKIGVEKGENVQKTV